MRYLALLILPLVVAAVVLASSPAKASSVAGCPCCGDRWDFCANNAARP
jgi:hypothetical protein